MDKELEKELLKYLKRVNAENEEPEPEPVRVRDYIDWGELGAMFGYEHGGPVLHSWLQKFLKK